MVSEGLFKELIENSNDILIITDPDLRIRYVSSSVERSFNIQPIRLLGKSIFSFVSADRVEKWRGCVLQKVEKSFQEEIPLTVGATTYYFDVQVSNFLDKKNINGLVLKLHDITAKKSKQKELERANEQLDQVIYKTTHDLKAPVMSAIGLIKLAEKANGDEKDKYLGLIKQSLFKLDSLIEEMNNFFRNEKLAVQREKIDIRKLLNDAVSDLSALLQDSKIQISVKTEADHELYTDSVRLKTIVGNILSNAVKYFDARKAEPFIRINVFITEEICELRFTDNGIGIEPEYIEKIFDLFFRATAQAQGTGLGLFIVKDTVERLKGTIEVESTPGQGTTFIVNVPNQILQPLEVE
ncbi:MAG TPA: ATP-binding protein [Chryseosolibacter sp.]